MDKRYLRHIVNMELTANEYRILLMLYQESYTQSQLAKELGVVRQNTNKYMARLMHLKLVEIDKVDGSNKYYKSITDMRILQSVMPGQLKF